MHICWVWVPKVKQTTINEQPESTKKFVVPLIFIFLALINKRNMISLQQQCQDNDQVISSWNVDEITKIS